MSSSSRRRLASLDFGDSAALPVAVLSILLALAILQSLRFPANDFSAFLHAGARFVAGQDLYAPSPGAYPFRYAPGVAALFAPFSLLEPVVARVVWLSIGAGVALYAAWQHARRAGPGRWSPVLAWICLFRPVMDEFHLGQADLAVLGFALLAFQADDADRPVLAGVLLAPAVGLKLTPVLLALDWVVRRRWRAVAGLALGAAAVVVAPALRYGTAGALAEHVAWVRSQAVDTPGMIGPFGANQSFWSMAARYGLPPAAAFGAAAVIVTLAASAPTPALRRGLLLLATPLVSAYGWIQNFVVAYPVVVLQLTRSRRSAAIAFALVGSTAFINSDVVGRNEMWFESHKVIGIAMAAFLLASRTTAGLAERPSPLRRAA